MQAQPSEKRRRLPDRRKCSTPPISRYTFYGGRRKTIRREEDRKKYIYVDLYAPHLLFLLLTLLLINCIDAYLTLTLLDKGIIVEENPVMAFYLEFGNLPFFLIKFFFTAVALTILCVYKNLFISRITLFSALLIYFLVILYELSIFFL